MNTAQRWIVGIALALTFGMWLIVPTVDPATQEHMGYMVINDEHDQRIPNYSKIAARTVVTWSLAGLGCLIFFKKS